ncbi:MAG: PilZ domain-containing protein [Candidatus Omnitrophica bacterium]|nr:PilZ domain-containing protein [Candidatus Omnitrophota bacterium]
MSEEKREAVRIKKAMVVMYSRDNKAWDTTLLRDISEKGLQITVKEEIAENETLYLMLKIPFRPFEWLEFSGRVRKALHLLTAKEDSVAGSYIVHIEFEGLKSEYKKLIQEYVAWYINSAKGGQR